MTTPAALLAYLRESGFALAADGDKLVIRPRDRLTPAECDRVRGAKFALLNLLAGERMRPCPRCRGWVDPDRGADVRTCCPRSDCPQGG